VKGLSERFFALAQNDTPVTSCCKVHEDYGLWFSFHFEYYSVCSFTLLEVEEQTIVK